MKNILDWIEENKQQFEVQDPRSTALGPRNMYNQGQLVTPSVDGSRPGYGGDATKLTLKEAANIRKTLPNGIGLAQNMRGHWIYTFFSRDKNGDIYQKARSATSKNPDIDGALKFLKEDREIFIKNNFPNRMTEKTFENLRWLDENIDLTKSAFADKLNKLGYTTYQGNKFTINTVMDWEKKLEIDKLRPKRTIRTVNDAKNIIRKTITGKEDISDLYKITDKGLRDAAIKKKAAQITGHNKAIAETGSFAGTTTKEAKLFRNYYEAHKKGTRIEIGGTWDGKDMSKRKNWPRDANGNVNWDIKGKNKEPAWKSVEFTDTQTPKGKTTFTYKNLANQVDNTFGKGFFTRSTTPYTTQKELYGKNIMFEGKMQPVGKVLARKAIIQNYQKNNPGKMPSEKYINNRMRAYAPGQVHHWAEGGVGADPYKVQFTSGAANRAINDAERTYKAALNKAGKDTAKIKTAKDNFIKSIEDISGKHGGIQYTVDGKVIGDKPSKISPYVSAAKETDLLKNKDFSKAFSKTFQDLSPQSVLQMGRTHGCLKKQEGGSIMSCLQGKFEKNPEKFLQRSAPLAKNNVNLFKWFKNGRKIARGTGVFAAWEAAFAPIVAGWMATEGESGARMLNEIAYGVPFIGETEKEEWMKYAGGDEKAYAMKRMEEMEEQEMPSLQYQLEQAQAKSAGTKEKVPGYTGYHEKEILEDIKEKEQALQKLYNIPEFWAGPTGKYLNEPVVEDAYNLAQQTKEKIAADKAARKEDYKIEPIFNFFKNLPRMAEGGRAGYMGGGIAAIRKPGAIAPTGGPMHQGLRSLYINDRDY